VAVIIATVVVGSRLGATTAACTEAHHRRPPRPAATLTRLRATSTIRIDW